ncbi:MAG TPA: hypothetical protein VHP83_26270 [Aggregatilineaceae bacterium]|nr:hypothetical protein [Aggregatilineaceae bacterium]
MYQNDAEVLFPARVIASLRYLRGEKWQKLVEHVMQRAEHDTELLAFSLLMIRVDGCLACHSDSFRALRGCTACAQQTIARYKGTDEDLIQQWEAARRDVLAWRQSGVAPTA